MGSQTKRCSKCGKEKLVTDFHKKGNGRRASCKECIQVWFRNRYREEHPVVARHRYENSTGDAKWCPYCRQLKPLEDFATSRKLALGRSCWCKACDRAKHLLRTYNMTPADYTELLESQSGKCAICGTTSSGGRYKKYFHVDHEHTTGRLRGLLCSRCNISIGKFNDDSVLLQKAADYLKQFEVTHGYQ